MNDNICAISTPLGVGAISIIRVSGPQSINIVNSIFEGKDLTKVKSHTINYGFISENGKNVDEVLVSVMKAPRTYTKEDIVEINCHGGLSTTNKVLELLLTNGCRLAQGGEFTKRAFLNGRIDLVQAEAVGDLINSTTEEARRLSLSQIEGELSKKIKTLRKKIVELLANIAVNIDYPEYEDAEDVTTNVFKNKLEPIIDEIKSILLTAKDGKIIKDGINVALIGRPNVGKSSILNKLLDEDKAIVSNIEGTTRDTVEGTISLKGIKFNFIDTAGIRKTNNEIEQIGVNKSKKAIQNADIVILVLAYNEKISDDEIKLIESLEKISHFIFINKNDQPKKIDLNNLTDQELVYGNTVEIDGIKMLKDKLIEKFNINKISARDFTYVSNARQISLLKNSLGILNELRTQVLNNVPVDILEIDLKKVFDLLGEITGETYKDELLDELFSNFCLGK